MTICPDEATRTIGHFLLWFDKDTYTSPEAAADSLLMRLELEGYSVVKRSDAKETPDAR